MKEIFKTPSGITLMEDLDRTLVSTNPAEVLCCLCSMVKSNNCAQQILAYKLFNICIKRGGIFMDPEGPKKIEAQHGNLFHYEGANGFAIVRCSAAEADSKVFEELAFPIKLVI